jgi:dipeptidyl aminopeptidase/acylaminoacyl peptidase
VNDANGWMNVTVRSNSGAVERVVAEPYEHSIPTWGPGQCTYAWSPDGRQIAFNRNEGGFGRLCVVDVGVVDVADVNSGAVRELGKGWHLALSWAGEHIVCLRTGGRTPTQIVAYNATTGDRRTLVRGPVAGWESFDLPEPDVVSWEGEYLGDGSPDDVGATVHGRLYRPTTTPLGSPPPLMVSVHGGPTAQTAVTFTSRFAYWLSRGWAILVPDHRGSSGWGRSYALAMHGRWGELDADDTAAGIRHAGAMGWCDPTRVAVTGGSAGGFTVLSLLARHPGLCAAGISLFGVADLLDLDETTHRFEKHYLHSLIGPLPGSVDRYRDRSAVNFAAKIVDPLLVLQGEEDRIVPPAQAHAVIGAVERAGGTVESHFYPGEGHGWGTPDAVIDELTRTEDFLRRHVLRWR